MPKFFIYLTALIGAGFTFAGSVLFYNQVLRGRKQAEAEILGVEVEAFAEHDEGTAFTAYRAKYEVRYQAEGRFFQLPLRGNLVSRTAEEATIKSRNNPVGSHRPIYYLPSRPEHFILEPLGRRFGLSLLFLSIGLAVLASSALFWYQAQPLDW